MLDVGVKTRSVGFRTATSEGVFEHKYEFVCSIKVNELRDQLKNYQLIKMNYASGSSVKHRQLASLCCYVRNFGLKGPISPVLPVQGPDKRLFGSVTV